MFLSKFQFIQFRQPFYKKQKHQLILRLVFLLWWRWRELNARLKMMLRSRLQVYSRRSGTDDSYFHCNIRIVLLQLSSLYNTASKPRGPVQAMSNLRKSECWSCNFFVGS